MSRDNGRLWIRADGETTPASNEAALWEVREDAESVADELGDWWTVVDFDDEDDE